VNPEELKSIVESIVYPGFPGTLGEYGFLKELLADEKGVKVVLDIPSNASSVHEQLELEIEKRISLAGPNEIEIVIETPPMPVESSSNGKNMLPNIQSFVMVSSGKGGVGKSTTTVNLAIALAKQGKRVGLLDTDIYGPNIPRMMGIEGVQPIFMGNKIKPIDAHGVKVMSMGSLIAPDASLIWKGAMVTQAIEQMLEDIVWGELDILIFDMPPGTGDAQLALAQNIPVSAGVCVTTPQKVALDDTVRALDMFAQLHIPIAGIVENMSGFICPDSGKEYAIFGKGTTPVLAEEYGTKVLAEIPIEPAVREGGDAGIPITVLAPECETSRRYDSAAKLLWDSIVEVLGSGGVDNTSIQPTIF
jgi:ATP-binding protein involved in chromosome partitioning